MLNPGIAYNIVAEQQKAMTAQAATAARVRATQRVIRGNRGTRAFAPPSWLRVSLRPRAA